MTNGSGKARSVSTFTTEFGKHFRVVSVGPERDRQTHRGRNAECLSRRAFSHLPEKLSFPDKCCDREMECTHTRTCTHEHVESSPLETLDTHRDCSGSREADHQVVIVAPIKTTKSADNMLVTGSVDGFPIELLIDTGASVSLMSEQLSQKLALLCSNHYTILPHLLLRRNSFKGNIG